MGIQNPYIRRLKNSDRDRRGKTIKIDGDDRWELRSDGLYINCKTFNFFHFFFNFKFYSGVTRGFGDHDLRALCTGLSIKPFLSPHPEVISRDLLNVISCREDNNEDGEYGILVMATDGLWDVLDTETVSKTVFNTLSKYPVEKHRYTMVAQELVAKSRGRANEAGHWRLAESKAAATVDDISVLVIPVYQYYKEYIEWQTGYFHRKQSLNLHDKLPEEHKGETDKGSDLVSSFGSLSVKHGICEGEEAQSEIESHSNFNKSYTPEENTDDSHVNGKHESSHDNSL